MKVSISTKSPIINHHHHHHLHRYHNHQGCRLYPHQYHLYHLHDQGFCCSFNTQSNGFESKVSSENTREDLDYEDFRNPQIEEEDNWDVLDNEKKEEVEESIDNPFMETMRSGGLVSRFFTTSILVLAPFYAHIIRYHNVITHIKCTSQQCCIKDVPQKKPAHQPVSSSLGQSLMGNLVVKTMLRILKAGEEFLIALTSICLSW